jgi:predicted amidohydrolase
MFVCKANAIGTFRGTINLGHSIIVAPNGVVVSEAGETQEEMLYFDIDPSFDWRWGK